MKNMFFYSIGSIARFFGYILEYLGDWVNYGLDKIEEFLLWCENHMDE